MKNTFDFQGAKRFALSKLKGELGKDLLYHSVEHTLDVMEASRLFAEMEGLQGGEIRLVETAALFHDIGFTKAYDHHEEHSIEIAREALPEFGYSQEDIEVIASAIEATKIPQKPQTLLEEVLADSDLNYLGRDDMFVIGQHLHFELSRHDNAMPLREWHELVVDFLKKHHYFTKSAIKLRETKKLENIRELEDLLANDH